MKPIFAIFLMLCLQVAMSPLCLCLGAGFSSGEAVPACCHAPADDEPAPCPHCDQEMPIAATSPVKAVFSADPPEWHGFELLFSEVSDSEMKSCSLHAPNSQSFRDFAPPPPPLREVYGIFLI